MSLVWIIVTYRWKGKGLNCQFWKTLHSPVIISLYQVLILTFSYVFGLGLNNMRKWRPHHYCCRYPFFTFLFLGNYYVIYDVIFNWYSNATLKVSAKVGGRRRQWERYFTCMTQIARKAPDITATWSTMYAI